MTAIKNIIFDLGGVLIDIDYHKTAAAFRQLGFLEFEKMYSQYSADKLFEQLETGHITEQAFYDTLLKINPGITQDQITNAWNAMLLDFRLSSLDYLKELKNKYSLYLLSNTNSIHMTAFNNIFTAQTGYDSIDSFFTKSYYSNLIGLRKPNKDIFEFVLDDANLHAEETLFIDDSFNNIETAKDMGFKTHLLLQDETIEGLTYG